MTGFFSRFLGRNEHQSFQARDVVSYRVGEITVYGEVLSPREYTARFGYAPDIGRVSRGEYVCLHLSTDTLHVMPASRLRKVNPKKELEELEYIRQGRGRSNHLGSDRDIKFLKRFVGTGK